MNKDYKRPQAKPVNEAYPFAQNLTRQQKTNANRRYQRLHLSPLYLEHIYELAYPDQMCAIADGVGTISKNGAVTLKKYAKLQYKKSLRRPI